MSNRAKFTDQFVRNLKPDTDGRRITYWDSTTTGFGLRVTGNGVKSFFSWYRPPGASKNEKRRLTLGRYPRMSLVEARDLARKAHANVLAGIDPLAEKRRRVEEARRERAEAITFGDFANDYTRRYIEVALAAHTQRVVRGMLANHVLPRWRVRRLADIGQGDVATLSAEVQRNASQGPRSRAGGVTQHNRVRSRVVHMFQWAIEQGVAGVGTNPARPVKAIGKEKARERFLSDAEIKAFWEALDGVKPIEAALYRTMLLTGVRSGEARRMRWKDIDTESWVWTVPSEFMKGRVSHRVPFVAEMQRLLTGLPKAGGEWVYASEGSPDAFVVNPDREFRKACRAADIEDFRPHDIRSTVATGIVRLGFSSDVADTVLAHKVGSKISRVYVQHNYDEEKRAALEAWAQKLTQILAGAKVISLEVAS